MTADPSPPSSDRPAERAGPAEAAGQDRPVEADPILVRRARISTMVQLGQRIGYGLFALAVVVFFVGFAVGFTGRIVAVVVASLVVGSVVLAPAIVFGYAVKAAARDDHQRTRRT